MRDHSLTFSTSYRRLKDSSLLFVFLLFPKNAALGYKKRVKDYESLNHIWFVCSQRPLAGKARREVKKEGKYHIVQLTSFIRKTKLFLGVITPFKNVERGTGKEQLFFLQRNQQPSWHRISSQIEIRSLECTGMPWSGPGDSYTMSLASRWLLLDWNKNQR